MQVNESRNLLVQYKETFDLTGDKIFITGVGITAINAVAEHTFGCYSTYVYWIGGSLIGIGAWLIETDTMKVMMSQGANDLVENIIQDNNELLTKEKQELHRVARGIKEILRK